PSSPGPLARCRDSRACSAGRELVVVVVVAMIALAGDLPDHAGLGDLHERPVGRPDELAPLVGLAEVAHHPVVDQVQGPVRPELNLDGTIDGVNHFREGLVRRGVVPFLVRAPGAAARGCGKWSRTCRTGRSSAMTRAAG